LVAPPRIPRLEKHLLVVREILPRSTAGNDDGRRIAGHHPVFDETSIELFEIRVGKYT
jgi:hypothetical protein